MRDRAETVLLLDQKSLCFLLLLVPRRGKNGEPCLSFLVKGGEKEDQAERVISATELVERIATLAPVVYQRGGLPRPFRENSSWERLGA